MLLCVQFHSLRLIIFLFFFFNDTATTEIYTLSLHDALPIFGLVHAHMFDGVGYPVGHHLRSEEHTSELQSRENLVCRLLLEKKKKHIMQRPIFEKHNIVGKKIGDKSIF